MPACHLPTGPPPPRATASPSGASARPPSTTTRGGRWTWRSSSPPRRGASCACRRSGPVAGGGACATPRARWASTGSAPNARIRTTAACTAAPARCAWSRPFRRTRCSATARSSSIRRARTCSTPTARRSSGWRTRGGWASPSGCAGRRTCTGSPPTGPPRASPWCRSSPACIRTWRRSTNAGATRQASPGTSASPASTPRTSMPPIGGSRIWSRPAWCRASSAPGGSSRTSPERRRCRRTGATWWPAGGRCRWCGAWQARQGCRSTPRRRAPPTCGWGCRNASATGIPSASGRGRTSPARCARWTRSAGRSPCTRPAPGAPRWTIRRCWTSRCCRPGTWASPRWRTPST